MTTPALPIHRPVLRFLCAIISIAAVVSLFFRSLPGSSMIFAGIAGGLLGLTPLVRDRNLRGLAVALISVAGIKGSHVFIPEQVGPVFLDTAQIFGVIMSIFLMVSTLVARRQASRTITAEERNLP